MPEPASRVSVRVNEHDEYACVCVCMMRAHVCVHVLPVRL